MNDLSHLASKLTEASFDFESSPDLLTVKDSVGGRVEFRLSADGGNDYEATVYGARRVLVINLVTLLAVYKLTANFTGLTSMPQAASPSYGSGGRP